VIPAGLRAASARRRSLRFYRRFVPRGGLCFDVGANLGDRTALFLSLGARVVAVEPHELCVESLKARFGDRVELVEGALGPEEGEGELLVASYHTLSSLSAEWVEAVRSSGRFSDFDWSQTRCIHMTTLDALVEAHGVPDFCKIDVEGYEREVLRGLSRPLPAVSFEFEIERADARLEAVDHLEELGMRRFNFSFGESMRLVFRHWTDANGIRAFLRGPSHTLRTFGDIYAAM
jgi:FkbM family methyltransferase